MKPEVVNLAKKLARFDELWSPKVVTAFNGHDVMVVKVKGEFVWHVHPDTDDLFLVLSGRLTIDLRDGPVTLGPGELFVVPRGVEHRPRAEEQTELLLIEPAGTPNTGDPAHRGSQDEDLNPMLLIPCPYCGAERPEIEFRHAGEAHIARPPDPSAVSDEAWTEYLYLPVEPEGRVRRALAARVRLRPLLQRAARHDQRPHSRVLQAGRAAAGNRGRGPSMTQTHRTPAGGSAIDRARPISFIFEGVAFSGYEGDTLASALLANGVRLFGRSYKYHRPRGIVAAGAEEPNALVGVARGPGRFTPNARATEIELYDGLVATSQNRWPSLRFDVGAINDVLAPLIGAGFYDKSFMGPDWFGPNWAWKRVYEPFIRRAAGLGNAPREPDPDRYHRAFDHCDVLIVGGGPAGLAAACAAAEGGADVVVCDEKIPCLADRSAPKCTPRSTGNLRASGL